MEKAYSILFLLILSLFNSCSKNHPNPPGGGNGADDGQEGFAVIQDSSHTGSEFEPDTNHEEDDIISLLPESELEIGAMGFWYSDGNKRLFYKPNTYNNLPEGGKSKLKPLGLVVKLNSKLFIVDNMSGGKDYDYYQAVDNAAYCHPYDNGRWRIPTLTEAKSIAKAQGDINYWYKRWEGSGIYICYNPEYLGTHVSDHTSSLFKDVDIEDGQAIINEVIHYEKDESGGGYQHALYISEIQDNTSNKSSVSNSGNIIPQQVWVQCVNCLGSGNCPYCYGQGHNLDMFGNDQDCPVCRDGRCVICAGHGGHYETT